MKHALAGWSAMKCLANFYGTCNQCAMFRCVLHKTSLKKKIKFLVLFDYVLLTLNKDVYSFYFKVSLLSVFS